MGDPRKPRKKYNTPKHPWQKERIESENESIKKFGIKNKKETWKISSLLKNMRSQAKKLGSLKTKQAEHETKLMLKKLIKLGLLQEGDNLASILILAPEDLMERRLQTVITKKGLAKSTKQARQMITHKHIQVNNKTITAPSYLVTLSEEETLAFNPKSAMASKDHPERIIAKEVKETKEEKPKEEKKEDSKRKKKKSDKK